MKLRTVEWNTLSDGDKAAMLKRPATARDRELSAQVREIIEAVRSEGDSALNHFTEKFDKASLKTLKVGAEEIKDAIQQVSTPLKEALNEAIRRISLFHRAQLPGSIDLEISAGVRCERRFVPIGRVGLYVPGGTAPLPSTVMMLGVPAKIAGCELKALATPPRTDGSIDPTILTTASLLGITEIYKIGGAQAIAALAYGTQTVPKTDKIYGPGNSWVTEAKLQVSRDPDGAACDLPAGPSEVMVIADASANAAFVASDLLSQAEHGADSQVVLISDSRKLLDSVLIEVERQLETLPRKEIAVQALSKSALILVTRIGDAIPICNAYAPEHLILQVEGAREFSKSIANAGSVFIGPWTPESVGDYASGTNHVLPTYGFARAYSGLSTESFMKAITFQELSPEGIKKLGPVVQTLAQAEGLEAHRNAVTLRLEALQK